jgi:HSP20 family protein
MSHPMRGVRFNPWREFDELFSHPERASTDTWVPAVDVWETSADYRIDVDIPAVVLADVEVSLEDGILEISGERSSVTPENAQSRHRLERRQGKFTRRFRLPDTADEENIQARASDGVLSVVIGKRASNQPRRIEIAAA